MKSIHLLRLSMFAALLLCMSVALPAAGQQKKPNILVIMTDDVGVWNISAPIIAG